MPEALHIGRRMFMAIMPAAWAGSVFGARRSSAASESRGKLDAPKTASPAALAVGEPLSCPSTVVVHGDPTGQSNSTNAILEAIAAVPADGGTICFPAGHYWISQTLDLGNRPGLRLVGAGRSGQSSRVGLGSTVLHFSGSGFCIQWAVGVGSAQFSGVTIESLHIVPRLEGPDQPEGGIYLGNSSNSLIAECTVSDFRRYDTTTCTRTGTGIRIGLEALPTPAPSSDGAQYNTIRDCTLSRNDIGVDNRNANGTRIMGGFIEDDFIADEFIKDRLKVRAGTYGVKFGAGSDTGIMVGVVVQGAETLVDISEKSSNITLSACRYEGFTTAIRIAGSFCSVLGGSMNNYIVGGGGTGIRIKNNALASFVMLPGIGATADKVVDESTPDNPSRSTILAAIDSGGRIEHLLTELKTQDLLVNKRGDGAQAPRITLQTNGLAGPIVGTENYFYTMFLDHAFKPDPEHATRLSLRVRGDEAFAIADGNKLGFFGFDPIAKPDGTPPPATDTSPESVLVLLNYLRAKLMALGLIG